MVTLYEAGLVIIFTATAIELVEVLIFTILEAWGACVLMRNVLKRQRPRSDRGPDAEARREPGGRRDTT